MLSLSKITVAITLSILINPSALANREHAELNRLLVELKSLERIVVIAEYSADKQRRSIFDYDQLRRDLLSIEKGIDEYINNIQRAPRLLPDINADYSR